MRVPMIAGNWKMNTTVGEAVELVSTMLWELDEIDGVDKVLCPPFVSLVPVVPFLAICLLFVIVFVVSRLSPNGEE